MHQPVNDRPTQEEDWEHPCQTACRSLRDELLEMGAHWLRDVTPMFFLDEEWDLVQDPSPDDTEPFQILNAIEIIARPGVSVPLQSLPATWRGFQVRVAFREDQD